MAHWRHLHQGTRPRHHGLRRHLFQGKRGKTTKPQQSNTTPKNLGHVDLKSCTTPKSCQTGEGVRCRCAFRGRRRQSTEACFALRGHPRQSTEAGFACRGRRQKNTEARRSKHKAGEGVRCYGAPKGLRQTCITSCSSSQPTGEGRGRGKSRILRRKGVKANRDPRKPHRHQNTREKPFTEKVRLQRRPQPKKDYTERRRSGAEESEPLKPTPAAKYLHQ